MTAEVWASIAVSIVTGGCGVWAARSARRTPRQERRDDFLAITEQQGKAIERLEQRVKAREEEADRQRARIAGQEEAIGWLVTRVRVLAAYIRNMGLEPPAADPVPEQARGYLSHIDV